jgi:hypothetical protein
VNLRTIGAWTTAGVAMWASLGALDVAGGPSGAVRIAMLPGLGMLAAAIALANVLGLLLKVRIPTQLRPGVSAAPGQARPHGSGESFLPLYALIVLVLPYLPWLPDWMPVLRVFAGPGKLLVWLIVASQVMWAILGAGRGRRFVVRMRGWSPAFGFAVLFAASLLIFVVSTLALRNAGFFPFGDEPHYLVAMQSLVTDHDLQVTNNYERRDYEAYFDGDLDPLTAPGGRDGGRYPALPVGLPVLAAPAFAALGYRGVTLLMIALASAAAALAWSWVRRITGSVSAATFAWSATALAVPFLASTGTVYPEIPAALAVLVAVAAGSRDAAFGTGVDTRATQPARGWRALLVGLAAGALPWLDRAYLPVSLALLAIGIWRLSRDRASSSGRRLRNLALVVGLYGVSVAGWLVYGTWVGVSPLPWAQAAAASGGPHGLAGLAAGVPGLLLDQEYGVLSYAPALVVGVIGLVSMWRAGGRARAMAAELCVVLAALIVTLAGRVPWWGGDALPGRVVLAGLLLLALPIAWEFRASAERPERRAAFRLLLLVGLAITLACVIALDGRLLGLERSGVSNFLAWLSPDWHFWAYLPDVVLQPWWVGLLQTMVWIVSAVASAWIIGRIATRSAAARGSSRTGRGLAFLRVDAGALLTVLLATLVMPVLLGSQLKPNPAPEDRERIQMLDGFDPRERPIGIRYAPLSLVAPDDVARLFEVSARPGSRRPQPAPVLLNARFALPAGRYTVELHPLPTLAAGTRLSGQLWLRVGRTGGAPITWTVQGEPGRPWTTDFDLPVDVTFVGFLASEDLDRQVGLLRLRPQSVVASLDRIAAYDVLGSWARGPFMFLFHDDQAYPEPDGFWVRGASRAIISVVSRTGRVRAAFRLRFRSTVPNTVRIDTPDQHWTLQLAPGQVQDIEMNPTARDGTLRVIVSPATGFRPSDRDPANGDRRFLGCWVQIAE